MQTNLMNVDKCNFVEKKEIDNLDINNPFEMAKIYSKSNIVPVIYQNNLPNTLIACNMSIRMNLEPLMVMQNLTIIRNVPGWSSQFVISQLNCSNKFSNLEYIIEGSLDNDNYGCRVKMFDKNLQKEIIGTLVTIKMAKSEGWFNKPGSKWQTMPEQMLKYRAATFFCRAYAPELLNGLHTQDEIIDIVDNSAVIEVSETSKKLFN